MKYIILLFIVMFFAGVSRAQVSPADIQFVRANVTDRNKKVLYTDSISSFTLSEMRKALDADTLYNDPEIKKGLITVFTKPEKLYIRTELDSMRHFAWGKGVFAKSRLIPADTISHIFGKKSNITGDGWQYFYTWFGKGFHEFSKPIFLRNNTMCIFYSSYHCGWLCADGNLSIYVKEGDKWVLKGMLYRWVS